MAKIIAQNPDGSILVQEDDTPAPAVQDPYSGDFLPSSAAPTPGAYFVIRHDLARGEQSVTPATPEQLASAGIQTASVAPPEVAAPQVVDVSQYALPPAGDAQPEAAPAAPAMAQKTVQTTESSFSPQEQASISSQMTEAGRQQQRGIEAAAEVGMRRAAQEAAQQIETVEQQERLIGTEMEKQRVREQRLNDAGAQLQNSLDNLSAASVDPNRYFASQDTGSQIAAGLAIGLGAVGAAMLGHKENPALTIIQSAIARDIDAQKAEIEKRKGVASVATSLYAQMREQFQDERSATAATQAMMLKLADLKLQKIAATTKNEEVAANAMTMSGKLNEDIALKQAQVLKELKNKITTQTAVAPADISEISKEIRDSIKESPQIKEYIEAREGLREFEIARANGVLGAGVISFVAKGLKQGSFGPEMLNILQWQSVPERVEEALRRQLGSSAESPLAQKLSTFLTAKEASMRADFAPQFERLDKLAKQAGNPGLQSFLGIGSTRPITSKLQGLKRVGTATKR
jgi:hypothetical protein